MIGMGLLKKLKSLFVNESKGYQTFTYFLPAPPARKSGYREKGFDNLVKELGSKGFEITDIRTQAISGNEQPGLWVIVCIRPVTNEALSISPSDFPKEFSSKEENILLGKQQNIIPSEGKTIDLPNNVPEEEQKDEVEGIYYID